MKTHWLSGFALLAATRVAAQAPAGADYALKNFKFETGETLPEVRLHNVALGKRRRDAGVVRNAVMVLRGRRWVCSSC